MAGSVADRVRALVESTVEAEGVSLWDVRFLKEGASWYLRIFIDSDEGINIDHCTAVSHAVDPILDEADPIDKSYYLEVCSAGLNRELIRPEHFVKMQGRDVKVCLYRERQGKKELCGTLVDEKGGEVTVKVEGEELIFKKGEYSRILLDDDK